MAGLESKTAVSLLQEYLVSKKMLPHYDLIHNGVGTHTPEFTFRVKAAGVYEEGTGRSKQEAKHRAAEKMLRTLKVICEEPVQDETNDQDQDLLENYVGQLKDVCYSQHYPEPKYYVEEEGGPPHNKIFKMVCCVSQLQEFGIHKTKKRAKQQAAFKMIQCLKEVGGKKIEEALAHPESPSRCPNKPARPVSDAEIIKKYIMKTTNTTVEVRESTALYKDHFKAHIGLQENSPTLTKALSDSNIITLENSSSLIEEIASELGVKITKVMVPVKEGGEYVLMTLQIIPSIGGVGTSEASAALCLLNSLVCLCLD